MPFRLSEFNSSNLEENLQIESGTQSVKVYTGGAWKTLGNTGAAGGQSSGLAGTTTPLLAETLPLWAATANTTYLSTGVMSSAAIYLQKGTIVTSLAFMSSTTAESNPVHAWAALYDTAATPALIGQSTDDAAHAWTANTLKKFTLASAYTVTTSGVYYASLMLAATVPTIKTSVVHTSTTLVNAAAQFQTGAFDRVVTSGTSLTTTAPGTIASTTVTGATPWIGVF